MAITDPHVLPADVELVPLSQVSASLRDQIGGQDGDFALTRSSLRAGTKVVDHELASLLESFREPVPIVQAVAQFASQQGTDPEQTLEAVYPVLRQLVQARLLTPVADATAAVEPSLAPGDCVGGLQVERCVHRLEDVEIYRCRRDDGVTVALKIETGSEQAAIPKMMQREGVILRWLDGAVGPRLLEAGQHQGRQFVVLEWCSGSPCSRVASELRRFAAAAAERELLHLCLEILTTYARLHAAGVVHGDIHPHNILADDSGAIALIDFAVARALPEMSSAGSGGTPPPGTSPPPRAGVAFFFEPEYARARLRREKPPSATPAGEQYALAALVYLLLTGVHYRDLPLERDALYREIADKPPLPFTARRLPAQPAVEAVLTRALAKDPARRYPTVAALAGAFAEAIEASSQGRPSAGPSSDHRQLEDAAARFLDEVGFDNPRHLTGLPEPPTASVNLGAAGIAMALYRMACLREEPSWLSLADVWACRALAECERQGAFHAAELGLDASVVGPVSVFHTASGVHCVRFFIAHAMADFVSQNAALQAFVEAADQPCDNPDLTLGRAGTLLAAALMLDASPSNALLDRAPLKRFGQKVFDALWAWMDGLPPIGEGQEMTRLGMAHGWAGLLYASLQWMRASGAAVPSSLAERAHQLAQLAQPDGLLLRWPLEVRGGKARFSAEVASSWCNGGAGQVFLWTAVHQLLGDECWLDIAQRTGRMVWQDPQATPGLCCGLAGRTYALLNLYRHSGEDRWLERCRELAARIRPGAPGAVAGSLGLFQGAAGLAALAVDLECPEASTMPLFEPEGWALK